MGISYERPFTYNEETPFVCKGCKKEFSMNEPRLVHKYCSKGKVTATEDCYHCEADCVASIDEHGYRKLIETKLPGKDMEKLYFALKDPTSVGTKDTKKTR